MSNVRVAQIGQLAVNQPVYEVMSNNKRIALAVNLQGVIEFVPPAFLKSIGLQSTLANRFETSLPGELLKTLKISPGTPFFESGQFPYVAQGTGNAFVADYSPRTGWLGLAPSSSRTINV